MEVTSAERFVIALQPLHDGLQGRIISPAADGGALAVGWYERDAVPGGHPWSAYLWRPDLRDSGFRAASSEAVRAGAQAVLDSVGPWWR